MNQLQDQIVEAWRAHNRIMIFTLNQIPAEALRATLSTRGGRDIARQFAHIHMVRIWHLENTAVEFAGGLTRFGGENVPDRKRLIAALEASGSAIAGYLEYRMSEAGTTETFRRKAVTTLGYFISHEAHHRGNILLTMKQSGYKLPGALKWGIWDWSKLSDEMAISNRKKPRATGRIHPRSRTRKTSSGT